MQTGQAVGSMLIRRPISQCGAIVLNGRGAPCIGRPHAPPQAITYTETFTFYWLATCVVPKKLEKPLQITYYTPKTLGISGKIGIIMEKTGRISLHTVSPQHISGQIRLTCTIPDSITSQIHLTAHRPHDLAGQMSFKPDVRLLAAYWLLSR